MEDSIVKLTYDDLIEMQKVVQLSKKCDIYMLRRSTIQESVKCFELLRPLSLKRVGVQVEDGQKGYYRKTYCVGHWLSVQRYNSYRTLTNEGSFELLRTSGRQIAKLVREDRRKEFEALLDLVEKLTIANEFKVEERCSGTLLTYHRGRVEFDVAPIEKIEASNRDPSYFTVWSLGHPFRLSVDAVETTLGFHGIKEALKTAYERLHARTQKIEKENETTLERMRSVIAHRMLLKR